MLRRRVQLTPARPAFQYPDARDSWKTYTWSDVGDLSDAIAAGLLNAGVEHEQRVAIASTTCVEWILACYGTALAGAATTTIYPNTTDEDVAYILSDSGSIVAFVEDADQAAKITAHSEHDGPAQGGGACPPVLDLSCGSRRRDALHRHGRPAVPVAAAVARVRQLPPLHPAPDRVLLGGRRPPRPDRRESGRGQADLHVRCPPDL